MFQGRVNSFFKAVKFVLSFFFFFLSTIHHDRSPVFQSISQSFKVKSRKLHKLTGF